MHGNSDEVSTRQVKVDNWGPFFLQRLQHFFNKNDFCDMTLLFSGEVKVQVHSLVLNACTDYFQTLEKKNGLNDSSCLVMPTDLTSELVLPIIRFMYTGKLEFKDTLTKKLYYTAGRLNMPILTKLLDAQGSADGQNEKGAKNSGPTIITKNSPLNRKIPLKELPETLPGRRLPIWKKRKTPISFDDPVPENLALSEQHYEQDDEPAKPTRFEWPEDEDTMKNYSEEYTQPFDSITYESAPLLRHKATPLKPVEDDKTKDTFEEVKAKVAPIKRLATTDSESASKKPKMIDIQSVKEYMQEQALRKQIVSNEEDGDDTLEGDSMAITETAEDDDDDDEDRTADPLSTEDSYLIPGDESMEGPSNSGTPQTKSILKQRVPDDGSPGAKKVRFSLNNQAQLAQLANQNQQTPTVVHTANETIIRAEGTGAENHAKIISEVLKKYPHLVQNNKNIKLRIMKQGAYPDNANKKVSYVVLKAGDKGNKAPARVIVKTGGSRNESISGLLPMPTPTPPKPRPLSGAENVTGPWLCRTCGTNEDPINFETYYQYRRHLQEVHMEKIDARICEHCGYRASKRNLLLYHLYTKHSVQPPANVTFPKCDQCEYIALSESLLIKHRNNHSNAKDFVCKVCNSGFKSNGALQGHIQANLHSDPMKKKHECPYCQKVFVRQINLKAHVRSTHKDIAERRFVEDLDDESADGDLAKKVASGEMSLHVSADAEALAKVAGGMTTSLSLVDHHHLTEVDQQTMVLPNADGTMQTFIISAMPGQEYIVPEMLAGQSTEQYQISASQLADLVQYDGSNVGAVVNSLGATGGQQTIVITSAPSGAQEQLKLISADGSTITGSLDQLALLTGQNILVANPDGTTSTAGEAGYQAILQPNGVLTLQPMGHLIQTEGEAVTEETLVQQGYVTQGNSILTVAQQEDKDGAANLIQFAEMDNKTYITYQQQPMQTSMDGTMTVRGQELTLEQLTTSQQVEMQEQIHEVAVEELHEQMHEVSEEMQEQIHEVAAEEMQEQMHEVAAEEMQGHTLEEAAEEMHEQLHEVAAEEMHEQLQEVVAEEQEQLHEVAEEEMHQQLQEVVAEEQEQVVGEEIHMQTEAEPLSESNEEYQQEEANNVEDTPIESVPIDVPEEMSEEVEKEAPIEAATEGKSAEVKDEAPTEYAEMTPVEAVEAQHVEQTEVEAETIAELESVEKELVIAEVEPEPTGEQLAEQADDAILMDQAVDSNEVDNEPENMIIDESDPAGIAETNENLETLTEGNTG